MLECARQTVKNVIREKWVGLKAIPRTRLKMGGETRVSSANKKKETKDLISILVLN